MRLASCSELEEDSACRKLIWRKCIPWVKNIYRGLCPNITERGLNLRRKGNKALTRMAIAYDRLALPQHRSEFLPPNCPSELSGTLEKR